MLRSLKQNRIVVTGIFTAGIFTAGILSSLLTVPALAQGTATPPPPERGVQVTPPGGNGANNQINSTQQNPQGDQLQTGGQSETTEAPPPGDPLPGDPEPQPVETNKPVVGLW